ncbi:MAG: hypothetical protein HRT68_06640 [Flavobacteriaceae bacterium]|nr:hypothetical protein [Flavobacteriaceae bacterium]
MLTIYSYLANNEIDKGRLPNRGMGFKEPLVYREKNTSDKYLNRRIEVALIEK